MKEFWEQRYAQEAYAYGELPNNFLKEKISLLPKGSILFPAEGEGRNAVYAATLGWKVSAYDISSEGKNKALQLSHKHGVEIEYQVGDLHEISFNVNQFDAVALIYAHFPAGIKASCHKKISGFLKKGGIVIFEAFSKNHLAYNSINEKIGGPKDVGMLFSTEEIKSDFNDFDIVELLETEVELSEGLYHNGKGSVIRFVGKKR